MYLYYRNVHLKMVRMINFMACVFSTHTKSLGGKQANKWLRKDAWRRGPMNNTGPLGHMNQFTVNKFSWLLTRHCPRFSGGDKDE